MTQATPFEWRQHIPPSEPAEQQIVAPIANTRRSFIFPLETNDTPKSRNALTWDRRRDLRPDCIRSLVTERFRRKLGDLLRRCWRRTSRDNPLKRNQKHPFHYASPFPTLSTCVDQFQNLVQIKLRTALPREHLCSLSSLSS